MRQLIFSLAILSSLYGCTVTRENTQGCIPAPEGFSEADLVGEWVAHSLGDTDKISIRNDGFYKQKISINHLEFEYESDWQPWWIDYSEEGVAYIHLKGLRLFAYQNALIKEDVIGGGENRWWDVCKKVGVKMPPGEGVLIVMIMPEDFYQPKGIVLRALQINDSDTWGYEFQTQ
jgi:hypothetical protein